MAPNNYNNSINKAMTVLDVVYLFRDTETVFKKYEKEAGVCLLCEALFDTLESVSAKYGINLTKLLEDLQNVAIKGSHSLPPA